MSTIADVAARAGVSKATASRALSGRGYVSPDTRERVTDAARALSYVAHSPATSLATGRTRTIGVIVPSVGRWFFAEMIGGVQDELLSRGYDLALFSVPDGTPLRERVFAEELPRKRFDGLIAAGIHPDAEERRRLLGIGLPVVCVGPGSTEPGTVSIDDAAAARIGTEHLIDLGHTSIAFIGGPDGTASASIGDERRMEGYRDAMDAAGLGDRALVVAAEPTMPGGYAAAVDLLGDRRRRPSAIIAVCDETAIGAIIAARRLGIAVPTELSVVGIDDHQHAEMFTLTTIRQLPREQGRVAVRLLMEQLERPGAAAAEVVAASALVVRNSTAVPRPVP